MEAGTRDYKPWTPEESDAVIRLKAEGKTWNEIGTAIGRTAKAAEQGYQRALREARATNGNRGENPLPHEDPALTFDLDRLLTACAVLTDQFDKLPHVMRGMVIDWLNKKYR